MQIDAFGFENMKEALHNRIVVTVGLSAHANGDVVLSQEGLVVMSGILAAAIRMMPQIGLAEASSTLPTVSAICASLTASPPLPTSKPQYGYWLKSLADKISYIASALSLVSRLGQLLSVKPPSA